MKIKTVLHYLLLIFIASIPLIFSNWLFFLKDPPIWPDEPVFLEMAKNLSSTGQAVTYIYGLSEIEFTGLGYPPLYFHLLGSWIKFFGSSIESVRFLSLTFAIFSLCTFFFITKLLLKNDFLATLATLFLAASVHFSRASHLGRMEMLLLFLISLSWFLFLLAQKKQNIYLYLAVAIFAALSPMTHPMGIISPIILITSLIFTTQSVKQKIFKALLIAIPVLFINIFWLVKTQSDLQSILSTLGSHLQGKGNKLPFILVLFQSDFSWWFLIILYLAVLLFFIPLALKSKDKFQQFTTVGLLVSLLITTIGKEGGYFLYTQPFIILALIFLLNNFKKISIILASLIFLSYLNIQYLNNDNIGITNKESRSVWTSQNFDYHDFTRRLVDYLPKDGQISTFIAATPDPYFDLKETGRFKILEAGDPNFPISDQSYKQALDSVDYLILTWVPHQLLADYINKNSEDKIIISQPKGYSALVVKLKPKQDRK